MYIFSISMLLLASKLDIGAEWAGVLFLGELILFTPVSVIISLVYLVLHFMDRDVWPEIIISILFSILQIALVVYLSNSSFGD